MNSSNCINHTVGITLSKSEIENVTGGAVFVPLAIAFGKGMAIGGGIGSLVVSFADLLDWI